MYRSLKLFDKLKEKKINLTKCSAKNVDTLKLYL